MSRQRQGKESRAISRGLAANRKVSHACPWPSTEVDDDDDEWTPKVHQSTGYRADALAEIDRLLRDHRTGDVALMDLGLLDLLHAIRTDMDSDIAFDVISGYRSPKTNEMLRQRGAGVNENSLHMTGRAIDVRLPGRDTAGLRDMAIAKRAGGVGYYAQSDFVHIDVGQIQTW